MNISVKKYLWGWLFLVPVFVGADSSTNGAWHEYATICLPRAAGADNLVLNMHRFGYRSCANDCFYAHLRATYEFEQNTHGKRLARGLFDTSEILFQGSAVTGADRNPQALVADYFGMSPETNTKLVVNPHIQNHVLSANLFIGLNKWVDGLYCQIDAPLVHAKWHLRHELSHKDLTAPLPTTPFKPGYMDDMFNTTTPVDYTQANLKTAAPVPTLEKALTGAAFGKSVAWQYGKFFGGRHETTELAAVNIDIGYHVLEYPDYQLGFYAHLAIPTGTKLNKSHAKYIFMPTVGDDHAKLGAGLEAHAALYNCDDVHTVHAYFQGYVAMLFDQHQVRSFDLSGQGHLSRYLLLKEFNTQQLPTGTLMNAINYTTRRAKVHVALQGEAVLELEYQHCNGWAAGIGYNIYGKTREEITRPHAELAVDKSRWGVKGISWLQVGGFRTKDALGGEEFDLAAGPAATAEAVHYLGATQSYADMYTATPVTDRPIDARVQAGADPGIAYLQGVDASHFPVNNGLVPVTAEPVLNNFYITQESGLDDPPLVMNATFTDINWAKFDAEPVLLQITDLDVHSAEVDEQVTHKLFGQAHYSWCDGSWEPFVRVGFEAEFAGKSHSYAMNTWGLFVSGGISY